MDYNESDALVLSLCGNRHMAGFVPATHAVPHDLRQARSHHVDPRVKPGGDGEKRWRCGEIL